MLNVRRLVRLLVVVGALSAAALGTASSAFAESCVYNPATKTVSAQMSGVATLVVQGGAIAFGAVPAPCGAATTTNTDTIDVDGAAGTLDRLVIDQRTGTFTPGATAEFSMSEIEFDLALGDADDTLIVHGTTGDDELAAGQNGISLNGDGDVDVVVSPGAFNIEVYLYDGNDFFNGARNVRRRPPLPRRVRDRRRPRRTTGCCAEHPGRHDHGRMPATTSSRGTAATTR